MATVISAVRDTVPISQFNQGKAGRIFGEVRRTGAKVVMKNNAPECVLLSPEEYVRLMDEYNDAQLLTLALERLRNLDLSKCISHEDLMLELGITPEDMEAVGEVEIE